MAKKNNNNKQKRKRNANNRMVGKQAGAQSTNIQNYARLLTNPCTGPLVHAPGSSDGGMIMRFETDFILGNGPGDTAGFFLWSPGAYNTVSAGGQYGQGCLSGAGATDLTTLAITGGGTGTFLPGYTYLTANASSYRCIAACMQVFWPGSEVNRQGIIGAAQCTYGQLPIAASTTVAALRSISPVVERMPTDYSELKWAPNFADGLFRNPSTSTPPEDGHAALLVSWGGLPVATGVRLRLVMVVEWKPKITSLVLSSNTSQSGAGDIQAVRRELDRRDANWWHRTGQAAAHFFSGLTVAYATTRGSAVPRIAHGEL